MATGHLILATAMGRGGRHSFQWLFEDAVSYCTPRLDALRAYLDQHDTRVLGAANVPVVQLSTNALKPAHFHFEMGARLAALREHGVMLMGSGNVVHNLRPMARDRPDAGFEWAERSATLRASS